MEKKSRVLVVHATGFIDRRLVRASLEQGHPTSTFVLMRPEIGLDIDKLQRASWRHPNHDGLVAAVKQADVVISAMSGAHILQLQHKP